jgi:hypothetical protein
MMSTYHEFELPANGAFDPHAVFAACIENGADTLLFDAGALPPVFFDLSSGVAGDLLHRLSVYRMRMAAVVPDPSVHSLRFQEFMLEANKGRAYRFFPHRDDAIRWLAAD